jgi:two-component system cell cycle response regulator DivK
MHPEESYVLVIDDDANDVLVTTELLRMIGVKYINARASGWRGLKLAESMAQVDLILLDIQLPYEDGYRVLERIRTSPKLQHTCVVAVTANLLSQDEARAGGRLQWLYQ